MSKKKENSGRLFDFGCLVELIIVMSILGGGYWWFFEKKNVNLSQVLPNNALTDNLKKYLPDLPFLKTNIPEITPSPIASSKTEITEKNKLELPKKETEKKTPQNSISTNNKPESSKTETENKVQKPANNNDKKTNVKPTKILTPWEKKEIRGIYLSRYQVTNNADERTIRERVRYYHSQGFNTIIHGVWGNGCTMYNSEIMQKTLGYKSCPNEFNDQWLDWLIDEAHKQGMEVHAYFEKGIKLDKNSPIFDLAIAKKWIVPGVDRTYSGIEHYVLDVEMPEVANFFTNILVEFVKKYPKIDAVQWDDYLGYHADLPGKVDRTEKLTKFVQKMITSMKKANPSVSFDLSHHNPYWSKRYFAADWENWKVDRVFIQAYNQDNFKEELNYARNQAGIAITNQELSRLNELVNDPKIKSIVIFPLDGKPEATSSKVKDIIQKSKKSQPIK